MNRPHPSDRTHVTDVRPSPACPELCRREFCIMTSRFFPNMQNEPNLHPQQTCGRPKNAKRTQLHETPVASKRSEDGNPICPTSTIPRPKKCETNPIRIPQRPATPYLCETNPILNQQYTFYNLQYGTSACGGYNPLAQFQPRRT